MIQIVIVLVLLMGGGAFGGLDKIISQRDKGTSIGFGAEVRDIEDKNKIRIDGDKLIEKLKTLTEFNDLLETENLELAEKLKALRK